jgi:hypothetical protein
MRAVAKRVEDRLRPLVRRRGPASPGTPGNASSEATTRATIDREASAVGIPGKLRYRGPARAGESVLDLSTDAHRVFNIRLTRAQIPRPLLNDEGHLAVALGRPVCRAFGSAALVGLDSGGRIRTCDLRVMSPIGAVRVVRPDTANARDCWGFALFGCLVIRAEIGGFGAVRLTNV